MAFSAAAGRGVWAENAVDTLAAHFDRAHNTLLLVQHRLEDELTRTYGHDEVNPIKIQSRLNKIQNELPQLEAECRKLLAAKQEFMDKTVNTLLENRKRLQAMQAGVGLEEQTDDSSFSNSLQKILKEWNEMKLS